MKIGIDASRANLKHKTGTEWYSFYLIKNLAKIDKENDYLLYLNKEPSRELKEIIARHKNFSFKVLHWPSSSFWTLGRLSLEMIFQAPDVLFVPAHGLPLFSPRRSVNTVHDLAFLRDKSIYRQDRINIQHRSSQRLINFLVKLITFGKYRANSLDYLYWSTKFALRKASKIIAVSNFTKNEIENFYPKVKNEKIRVVYNGYNSDLYQLSNDEEKIQAALDKYGLEKPFFLYVGRLEKKKNTPALIEAMSILRESYPEVKEKLVLIGDASFGYDEVKFMIEEYDLEREVMMPGWIEEEDMPYIFEAASVFVFPTKYEGFGIPVLQAMACGLPVAASDIPVLHEVAGEAAIYFDYRDSCSIALAMKSLVSEENLQTELRKKGLERIEKFNFEKCARETLAVLLEKP